MMTLKHIGIGVIVAAAVLAMSASLPLRQADAVDLSSGEVEASLDTTISYGVTVRVEGQDPELTSSVNDNEGASNYKRGIVSNAAKFTSDLEIGYQNIGLFLRATGFFDYENENGVREYRPLSADAKSAVGKDLDLLDAYVSANLDFDELAVDVRLGNHVLNWGESTFIQNGINAVNPFDVSKLRVPGSELREALVAVPLVSASVAGDLNFTMEGFYQIAWEKTEIDAVGSYFSVTDYVGPGAENAVIALPGLELGDMGLTADPDKNPFLIFSQTSFAGALTPLIAPNPDFLIADREQDHDPRDSGQWGIGFRYLAEGLNNTEFGLYFMNYHSRLPVVSAHTGTAVDAGRGLVAAQTIGATAAMAVEELVRGAVGRALAAAQCPSPTHSVECGAIAQQVQGQATAQLAPLAEGAAGAVGIDAYAKEGHYFIEYPEDIQLYGVSFNTTLGPTGFALQGEYSYRRNAPLQLAERKVFADALGPFTGLGGCIEQKARSGVPPQQATQLCIGENAAARLYDADTVGYVLRDVSQTQATVTKVFGPVLGADGGVFVAEAALMHVHDIPDGQGATSKELAANDKLQPLESPAGAVGDDDNDADATSWGYRLAARLDYNRAIGAVNLFPYIRFGQDVSGNSPAPSGSFVEGRTALTFGLSADYLSRWQADLSYTQFAGRGNKLRDRDFITATVKYSF
ncbi:MAG: DUF1302 domain-containing protein [Deltaproteobacteria bacterium]|nr:DUF1302 domain-containing protein [Deltaproteobacteria bacterium]